MTYNNNSCVFSAKQLRAAKQARVSSAANTGSQ